MSPTQVTTKLLHGTFKVQVKVSNMDPFNAWDIQVRVDPAVLNATNLNIYPNLFSSNYSVPAGPGGFYEQTNCLNGVGIGCLPNAGTSGCAMLEGDGPGVAHSTVTILGPPPMTGPTSGLLFTITFKVIGTGGYSPIDIQNDLIVKPVPNPNVPHATTNGEYGTPSSPDISIRSDPLFPLVPQGSRQNATISLRSIGSFAGTVQIAASPNVTGVTVNLTPSKVLVKAGMTNTTILTINVAPSVPAGPPIQVCATAASGSITRYLPIIVSVLPPGAIIAGMTPSQLPIHAGNSGNTTVTVKSNLPSPYGYGGPVSLRAVVTSDVSPISGVQASLSSSSILVASGGYTNVTLFVTTPPSVVWFTYTVTVYANGTNTASSTALTITPPLGDVQVAVNPSPITVQAGSSVNATISIASQDYLWGTVNIAASMSSGAAQLGTTTWVINPDLSNSRFNVTLRIAIDSSTTPGNYNLTLTVYTLCATPSGRANNCVGKADSLRHSMDVAVAVTAGPQGTSNKSSPVSILGLPPVVYFGILGVAAAVFAVLTVQTYRKSRE